MQVYSRQSPSPRYVELLGFYREMHVHGAIDQNITPENTFPGKSLFDHAPKIKEIISILGSKTILDYGAGKGMQYQPMQIGDGDGRSFSSMQALWNVESISCYDPGFEPFNTLPEGRFDGVVSTDVLEHCPREDLPWIIAEIFGFAREFVYLNVACYAAVKTLPNGENAHCTVEPIDWWLRIFDTAVSQHPHLRYFAAFDIVDSDASGNRAITTHRRQGKWQLKETVT